MKTEFSWSFFGFMAILGVIACLGFQIANPFLPVDLFHAAFFNGCTLRTYQVHWQDQRRYPDPFPFGMATSPESVAVFVLWIENGPAISLSRELPLRCAALNR